MGRSRDRGGTKKKSQLSDSRGLAGRDSNCKKCSAVITAWKLQLPEGIQANLLLNITLKRQPASNHGLLMGVGKSVRWWDPHSFPKAL